LARGEVSRATQAATIKARIPNLAATIMPHATANEESGSVWLATNERPSTHSYLSLLASNGQSTFLRPVSLERPANLNISLGQFELPFAGGIYFADNGSTIWNDFDALQAPYPTLSEGKQGWTLSQDANGPMAELLSHLGSQFYGKF
jgi:hypothetical protein